MGQLKLCNGGSDYLHFLNQSFCLNLKDFLITLVSSIVLLKKAIKKSLLFDIFFLFLTSVPPLHAYLSVVVQQGFQVLVAVHGGPGQAEVESAKGADVSGTIGHFLLYVHSN